MNKLELRISDLDREVIVKALIDFALDDARAIEEQYYFEDNNEELNVDMYLADGEEVKAEQIVDAFLALAGHVEIDLAQVKGITLNSGSERELREVVADDIGYNLWAQIVGHGIGFWDGDYKMPYTDDQTVGEHLSYLSEQFRDKLEISCYDIELGICEFMVSDL